MARGPLVVACEIEFPDQSSSLGLCMGSTASKQMIGASPRAQLVKESACNAGDPGLIPGLARSAGEGIGYPLQYSWVSLVAHLVKNPSAMWETWVQSLGWEDPLKKGKATHSSILAWKIPWTGSQRVGHD